MGSRRKFAWVVLIILVSKIVEFRVLYAAWAKSIFGAPTDDLNPATLSALVSVLISSTLTALAIWLKRGASFEQYLAVRKADWRGIVPILVLGGFSGIALIWVRLPTAASALDASLLSQDLLVAYLSMLLLAGPIAEEALFRGFAISGFLTSRFASGLAVPLSSALWSLAHAEPAWINYGALFVYGCLLGVLRLWSGSILPSLSLHIAVNLGALVAVLPRSL